FYCSTTFSTNSMNPAWKRLWKWSTANLSGNCSYPTRIRSARKTSSNRRINRIKCSPYEKPTRIPHFLDADFFLQRSARRNAKHYRTQRICIETEIVRRATRRRADTRRIRKRTFGSRGECRLERIRLRENNGKLRQIETGFRLLHGRWKKSESC